MAALEAWEERDHAAVRACERRHLELWREGLAGEAGIAVRIVPDPTGNPLDRLEVAVDPAPAGLAAWELAEALAAGDPPVMVRGHEIEHGRFQLDPCNLHDGEAEIVLARLRPSSPVRGPPERGRRGILLLRPSPSATAARWRRCGAGRAEPAAA